MIPKTGKRRSGKTDKGGPIAKRKSLDKKQQLCWAQLNQPDRKL